MDQLKIEDAIRPLVEPLSEATGRLLQKIDLFKNDFLSMQLSPDGRAFIIRPLSASVVTIEDLNRQVAEGADRQDIIDQTFQKNGQTYQISQRSASGRLFSWIGTLIECKRIEAAHNTWSAAATDTTVIMMYHSLTNDHIRWVDQDTKLLYISLLARFLSQTKATRIVAEYKINGIVPDMPDDYVETNPPLMPQQRVGVVVSLNQPSKALFMEQGTGKTATVVARVNIEAVRKRNGTSPGVKQGMYRHLVVCPRSVRSNWAIEFTSFSTSPGKIAILRGGVHRRATTLVEAIKAEDGCVWSTVILPWDTTDSMKSYLKRVSWDLITFDESHMAKSSKSRRWLANREVVLAPFSRQVTILSGTPIANSLNDLYGQLELLGDGLSGFSSREAFRKFYGKYKNLPQTKGVSKLIGAKNIPLLQERLARMSFIVSKKEARLNLPDKMYAIHEVYMTTLQKKWYKTLAEELALELEDVEDSTISVNHILTKLLRLTQITSGHVKPDREIDPDTELPIGPSETKQIPGLNPKVEEMVGILTGEGRDPLGKTIIWACFIEDIRIISERLKQEGISFRSYYGGTKDADREIAIKDFNDDPECKVFLANPAAAGAGLNLVGYDWWSKEPIQETYTDMEIFFSQNWSAVLRSQAEDRAHRKGTRQPVQIIDLVVPGTIDEEIRARVTSKLEKAMAIQDIRNILEGVLDLESE
ncbi:MAG: hypothetical protein COA69_09335 [Robiginitomaculum sp.]|nr:MAG: hypothetical protein COA69_09335 [Robiginitomaculum sp.]